MNTPKVINFTFITLLTVIAVLPKEFNFHLIRSEILFHVIRALYVSFNKLQESCHMLLTQRVATLL